MSSPHRIYHTWDKWECYPAGFYEMKAKEKTEDEAKEMYRAFLSDLPRFGAAMERVLTEWPNSCEHYLTNQAMNRVAWLGQASACIHMGLPSKYRSGYFLLSDSEKKEADALALEFLNRWLFTRGFDQVDLENAGVNSEVNLY